MKFEANAIEPLYEPYPAPKLLEEPLVTPDAEFKRAAQGDSLRQVGIDDKDGFLSPAQLVATQVRCIVAGGLAGVRDDFGGFGPQLGNLPNIALVASTSNHEPDAELRDAPNAEWRQLPRDRRDLTKVKKQMMELYQPRITRTLTERTRASEVRTQKPFARK